MMSITSISCMSPFCHPHSDQTDCSVLLRTLTVALGVICLISGTLLLSGVTGVGSIATPIGAFLISIGSILTLMGMFVYCRKQEDIVDSSDSMPQIPETSQRLISVFDNLCQDERCEIDSAQIEMCKAFIAETEAVAENPERSLEIANSLQLFLDDLGYAQLDEMPEYLQAAQNTLNLVYETLGTTFLNRGRKNDIDHAVEIAISLGFEKGERLYAQAIQGYLKIDYLYALGAIASMPPEFKNEWKEWGAYYQVGQKYIEVNLYRSAFQIAELIPEESSFHSQLLKEIKSAKAFFMSKHPNFISPYRPPALRKKSKNPSVYRRLDFE